MKLMNYTRNYESYSELFERKPELNISIEIEGVDIQKEKMPFGKYQGMTFMDLIEYDRQYFNYMKNKILSEKVSSSLNTYYQRVKMLRVMISVERYCCIERYGEDYERRKRNPDSIFR